MNLSINIPVDPGKNNFYISNNSKQTIWAVYHRGGRIFIFLGI